MNGLWRRRIGVLGIAAAVLLSDQVSKHWAQATLGGGSERPLLPGLVSLQLVHNQGAAFSLFSGAAAGLGLISAVASVVLLIWILRLRALRPLQFAAAALLLGGTLGNGLDRWRLGAVVDFVALVPINFPVFNLADVAINMAVLCLGLDLLQRHGSIDS